MEADERSELQRLIIRLAEGDRSAFRPAFDLVWPLVRPLTGKLLPDSGDAEDAAQSTLMKVFFRAAEFDANRDALPWIAGIAVNECRSLRHKGQRRREDYGSDHLVRAKANTFADPEEQAIRHDLILALAEVVASLRPTDAEAIAAAVFDERIPTATFRKRVQRALTRLRSAWRTKHGVE